MKKLFFVLACILLGNAASAQGILDRFSDPEKGRTVFIPKGNHAIGIGASYRSFEASGENAGDGYSILSLLNIGDGRLNIWSVSPSLCWFVADDFSIGVRLDYSGYRVNTNLLLDFRDVMNDSDPDLNLQISSRHMVRNVGGLSFTARRYVSFFGSKTFGVFGEGRLFGNYGVIKSHPLKEDVDKFRTSRVMSAGLKFSGGACIKLRDNSALSISVPILGGVWKHSTQKKEWKEDVGHAKLNSFNISRNVDLFGIQVGYTRFIDPANKKKK